ncbi:MAG: hypothetical protein K8R48_05645 [Alphaproteobacteria bacterium]|nr:hypothetical protein [Alphaproteobacteria bacterium]
MRKLPSLILQFAAAATLAFSGCTVFPKTSKLHNVKIGSVQENSDVFVGVDDLAARLTKIKKGMSDTAVYDTLGVSPKRFYTIPDDQKMKYVDGPQVAQPHTAEEQDKIKARADSYTVRELVYRSVTTKAGVNLVLTKETQTTGYDLRLQVTFKDGILDKVTLAGIQEINRYNKETIISLISTAARGGGADALQLIIKNSVKVPGL